MRPSAVVIVPLLVTCCLTAKAHGSFLRGDKPSSMCHGAAGWRITFEDEFNGNSLNASVWTARNNVTHGPTEKELYVSSAVSVEDGTLILTSKKEVVRDQQGKVYNFTSGWVDTEELKFQKFGRFEVKAKLPSYKAGRKGQWPDAWPAHWLMPNPSTSVPKDVCWPVGGEIDILETYEPTPTKNIFKKWQHYEEMFMSFHWATQCGHDLWNGGKGTRGIYSMPGESYSDEYHTYAVEWTNTSITWFVDGIQRNQIPQEGSPKSLVIPQDPFYMILNTALNPWSEADADSGYPLHHIIDRVTWCEPDQ